MARDLKEAFFRLDGAWASFELESIRRREDYLKPFRVLRCKIDDQVDFQTPGSTAECNRGFRLDRNLRRTGASGCKRTRPCSCSR